MVYLNDIIVGDSFQYFHFDIIHITVHEPTITRTCGMRLITFIATYLTPPLLHYNNYQKLNLFPITNLKHVSLSQYLIHVKNLSIRLTMYSTVRSHQVLICSKVGLIICTLGCVSDKQYRDRTKLRVHVITYKGGTGKSIRTQSPCSKDLNISSRLLIDI